jgi:hypothetical protein
MRSRSLLRDLALLPAWKMVPANWLSCPTHGQLVQSPIDPNAKFLPMKAPLPDSFSKVLGALKWTIADVKALGLSLSGLFPWQLVAVNVSSSPQVLGQRDWESAGIKYTRCPVKRSYERACLDQFIGCVDSLAGTGPSLFLVYSGKGLSRVSYCIAGYLGRVMQVADAITQFGLNFYKQKPLDILTDVVYLQAQVQPLPHPAFLDFEDCRIAIGQIPLTLESYKAIKRVARKEVTSEDGGVICSHLPEQPFRPQMWNASSLDELRRSRFLCSFEARGAKSYLVATNEKNVFLVDSRRRVWLLRVHAPGCAIPLVAACYFIEEKHRCVVLLTDLVKYGNLVTEATTLDERQSLLARHVCRKMQFDGANDYDMMIFYRPLTKLRNVAKLRSDMPKLFVKSDGIIFQSNEQAIFLPIEPSVLLQLEYNGAGKAILLAAARKGEEELTPVALYNLENSKFIGLNRRTSRFEFEAARNEWIPIALGNDDEPATVQEVDDLVTFLKSGLNLDSTIEAISKIKS